MIEIIKINISQIFKFKLILQTILQISSKQMNKSLKQKQVVRNFMNLCATMIQSHLRGYLQRKYYKKFLPVYRRFKQLLYAGFLGWKTRKVFKLYIVKAKINDIAQLKKQAKSMQLRIAKRDFSDQISRLLKNGLWIFYFLKQKKTSLSMRSTSLVNTKQSKSNMKTNLKHALQIIPKPQDKKASIKTIQGNNQVQKAKKILEQNKISMQQQQECLPEKNNKKELKFKKCQIPLKQIKKIQKQLVIQTNIREPQENDNKFAQCQTPSQFLQQKPREFSFHTKPRNSNPFNNSNQRQKQIEPVFMKIDVSGHSSRKGLNMTLSKKYTSQNKQPVSQVSPCELSKTSINGKQIDIFSQKYSSLSTNDRTPLNQISQTKNLQIIKKQNIEKLLQKKGLATLDLKKQDFQKKKMQFQKRSQKFKSIAN